MAKKIADIETTLAKAEKKEDILRENEAILRKRLPKINKDNSGQMTRF